MYKGTFKHDPYMHFRMIRRAERDNSEIANDLQVTFVLELDFDSNVIYPETRSWDDFIAWLEERKIKFFTYRLFTNDWRRWFSFVDPKDAMLVKLAWKDAPASGWKRPS